jgi:hypothetical protein
MVGRDEYLSQMNLDLHLIFASERSLSEWLELEEARGFSPADERAVGHEMFKLGGGAVTPGQTVRILTDEVLAALKVDGVDWAGAIRRQLEEAESKWPAVSKSHQALWGQIKVAMQ